METLVIIGIVVVVLGAVFRLIVPLKTTKPSDVQDIATQNQNDQLIHQQHITQQHQDLQNQVPNDSANHH